MNPDATRPLGLAKAGPRIIQLSPIPGNIYDADRFYYDPTANVSCGNFGAILAFTLAHSRPVVIHDCPYIYEFQVAHPSAVVRPVNKVPLAIIAWGLALLDLQADSSAPLAIAQHPPAVAAVSLLAGDPQFILQMAALTSIGNDTPSVGSASLLSYKQLSSGGDPPSVGVVSSPSVASWASVGVHAWVSVSVWGDPPAFRSLPAVPSWVPPPVRTPRVPLTVASPRPDHDGFAEPPSSLGGQRFEGYSVPPPLHGEVPHSHGGGSRSQHHNISFPSSGLMADHWHTFNFPGGHLLAVPPFFYGPSRPHPSHGGSDFPSLGSTTDLWHCFNFPGGLPPHVQSVIHGQDTPDPSPPCVCICGVHACFGGSSAASFEA
jgi:hypothetical protein